MINERKYLEQFSFSLAIVLLIIFSAASIIDSELIWEHQPIKLSIAAQEDTTSNHRSLVMPFNESSVLDDISFSLGNTTFYHHIAAVNGIQLHYVIGGQGDPIVLLHGWPQTWYEWRHVMPVLAENYTVIVPDLRGLGDSSKPATGYDGNTTAEDIYQLVSQLGFNEIVLVGHDVGAQTAYSYAVDHPNNVTKMVIMDFIFPGFIPQEFGNGPWWWGFHQARDIPEMLTEGKERQYLSWFYKGLAYNPEAISEEDIDEFVSHYAAPGGMRSGFEYYRAFPIDAQQNIESAKAKITMPVLVFGGDIYPALGGDFPGNLALNSTKALATNVTGITVPLSGHWIPEEQPEFVIEQLFKFFGNSTMRDE